MTVFALPDLGEGLTEAEIICWQVAEGDRVAADQPLVSVETDKAVVEVPSPCSGSVTRLLAEEGAIVAVGAPLAEIDRGRGEASGAIVGELKQSDTPRSVTVPETQPKGRAAPAVRRLALERGVDLGKLTGTGPDGSILSADVLAAATALELEEGEALRGVRRAMAKAMSRSHSAVVPSTVTDRAEIDSWAEHEGPTLRLIRAIVTAAGIEPALNAWFDGTRRQLHTHVDVGLAVDTADGLFVPVLRGADSSSGLAERLTALRKAVELRTIAPGDLKGATISLSNFGMIGGEYAAMVVTPPQVAILGAGRISEACVAIDGRPEIRSILPLSLTFDHRAVTGSEAARFLVAVRDDLQSAT